MAVDNPARILGLSAMAATTLSETIVSEQTVGGIVSGQVFKEGTSTEDIINALLSPAPTPVTIYVGATTDAPTGITGLTAKSVINTNLLDTDGYILTIMSGVIEGGTAKGQYPVIALPNDGTTVYTITKWEVSSLSYDIPHTYVGRVGDFNIYHLNNKSYDSDIGGVEYRVYIKRTTV